MAPSRRVSFRCDISLTLTRRSHADGHDSRPRPRQVQGLACAYDTDTTAARFVTAHTDPVDLGVEGPLGRVGPKHADPARPQAQDAAGKEFGDPSEAEVVVFKPLGEAKFKVVARVAAPYKWTEWAKSSGSKPT